jgi:hypothetical protein
MYEKCGNEEGKEATKKKEKSMAEMASLIMSNGTVARGVLDGWCVVWDRYTPNNCMLALRKFASIISSL